MSTLRPRANVESIYFEIQGMNGATFKIRIKLIGSSLAWVRLAMSDDKKVVRRFSKRRYKHALNSIHEIMKLQNN